MKRVILKIKKEVNKQLKSQGLFVKQKEDRFGESDPLKENRRIYFKIKKV